MYSSGRANNFARKKKKIKFKKYTTVVFVVLFLIFSTLVALGAYISKHEKFTISSLRILGNEVVNSEDVEKIVWEEIGGKYLWIFNKESVFLYPKNILESRVLGRWARISNIDIYADTMTSLTVRIEEREPVYIWCDDKQESSSDNITEECYFLDDSGFIFSLAPYFSGPVFFKMHGPIFDTEFRGEESQGLVIGKRFLSKDEFEKIVILKNAFILLEMKAVEFKAQDDENYQFIMEDGAKILFNKEQSVETLLDNLDSSLDALEKNKQLDYIDLRFGNKVFYKFVE